MAAMLWRLKQNRDGVERMCKKKRVREPNLEVGTSGEAGVNDLSRTRGLFLNASESN
jgi:hypothetical protein